MSKEVVSFRLDAEVKTIADKIAISQGVAFSEYVRNLIISDLDKRTFFTSKVKAQLAE